MIRTVVLIDGGYLRAMARTGGREYTPDFIELTAHRCVDCQSERLVKIMYYDCPPYEGVLKYPVSSKEEQRTPNRGWLENLAKRDYFAVRLGKVKFRGFALLKVPPPPAPLTDEDFKPVFEQKGVDMRIGIDIASMCERRIVDRIILVSGDTDMVPAMKHARKSGVQVVMIELPGAKLVGELFMHADLRRQIEWPKIDRPAHHNTSAE